MENIRRILLVADDPAENAGLKAIFEQLPAEWKLIFSSAPDDALSQLDQIEFDAVFVDLAAGPGAGTTFLQEVWRKQPKPVRFLLGGSVDQQTIVTCVLGANQFLEKPLDLPKLQAALNRAEAIDRLVRNKKIQTLVSRMRTFPSRPSLYIEVMREIRSSDASPQTVGELVAKDLAISTKLLQVVNSAYYGMAQHVSDPGDAVLMLGLEATASLVLSIEAFARFDKVKPIYFSVDRVWKHSQSVAQTAKKIAEYAAGDAAIAKEAYTAGLLHDIGKLTLALNFEEQYQGALNLAQKQGLPPWEVETEVFGASHAEIGAYLLSLWALPFPIVEAVAAHHTPAAELPPKFSAVTALHLAEKLENEEQPPAPGADPLAGLDYPPELRLENCIQTFRELAKGAEPGADSTRIITRNTPSPAETAFVPGPSEPRSESSRRPRFPSKFDPHQRRFITLLAGSVCAVLLLLGLGYSLVNSISEPPQVADAAARTRRLELEAQAAAEAKAKAEAEARATAQAKAEALAQAEAAFALLKLQAIMYRGPQSTVIINGKTARLGEEISGARIVAIAPRQVTLEHTGHQRILEMR